MWQCKQCPLKSYRYISLNDNYIKCKKCPLQCYRYTYLGDEYIKFKGGNKINLRVEIIMYCIERILQYPDGDEEDIYLSFDSHWLAVLRKKMMYIIQKEYDRLPTNYICYDYLGLRLKNTYHDWISRKIKIEETIYKSNIDMLYLDILMFLYGYPTDEDNMLFNHLREYIKNNNMPPKDISYNEKEKVPDFSKCYAKYKKRSTSQRDSNLQNRQKKYLVKCIGKCILCGKDTPECLIFSHIKPWKKCTEQERRDIYSGLLLCADHDNLFDKGYITFDNNGDLIISSKITKENQEKHLLNIYKKISTCKQREKYLKYHRKNIFKE